MAFIPGTAGPDILQGTSADDEIVGLGADDGLSGNDGDDLLRGGLGKDTLDGGAGIDTADYSEKSMAVAVALGGSRTVQVEVGGVQEDTLKNVENVTGGSGDDGLTGDGMANVLRGGEGQDTVRAGSGDDRAYGDRGDDKLYGGAGDDILDGGTGYDGMNGGDGDDTYYVDQFNAFNLSDPHDNVVDSSGIDTVYSTVSYRLGPDIENLVLLGNAQFGFGNDLANSITGDVINNYLYGGDGDDSLFGGGSNDRLKGEGGNDDLDGGDGIDLADFSDKTASVSVTLAGATPAPVMVGGTAEDTVRNIESILGGSADDTLVGDGLGNDLNGGAGNDVVEGRDGNDYLTGGIGDDWLKGGEDDDQLTGGTGYDVLEGGMGDDTYSLAVGDEGDAIIEVGGIDTVRSGFSYTLGADLENLTLTAANLIGIGNDGDNTIYGSSDARAHSLHGNDGNDTLAYGRLLEGGAGDDTLMHGTTLKGGMGRDLLIDGGADYSDKSEAVVVTLIGGQDSIVRVGGVDEDTLRQVEHVTGGSGDDKLKGDQYKNQLRGGAGKDGLWGGAGDDQLYGNDGDDFLQGGEGRDRLDGGAGIDTADFSDLTAWFSVQWLSETNFRVQVSGSSAFQDDVSNVENITGGSGNDAFTGNAMANVLDGGAGNDVLSGLSGDDMLGGGAGDDLLKGGAGRDSITGGTGFNDTVDYRDKTEAVSVALRGTRAVDVFVAGVAEDSIWNIENVYGGSGNDTLTGDGGNNLFRGGTGQDALDGGAGVDTADFTDKLLSVSLALQGARPSTATIGGIAEDTIANIENLLGGLGDDSLGGDALANFIDGGVGQDVLWGGTGDDVLVGGAGNDFLKGGGGNDRFVFDAALGPDNIDTIDDFRVGGDLVELGNAIFKALTTLGTLSADAFWTGAEAHDANDRIIYNDVSGALFYDVNGSASGGSVQFATLDPGRALTHSDFVVT